MRAKIRTIKHPSGISVETPLLIPSFSSKGFSIAKNGESEAAEAFRMAKEFLTDSLLISAYDVHHKYIPFSENDIYTDLTVIDSGGYETSDIFDLPTTSKFMFNIGEWDRTKFRNIIEQWPEHKAGIIVSYDHGNERNSLESQVKDAKELFGKYPGFLNDFLIKPETRDQSLVQVSNIVSNIAALKDFSIIGVTEKELGSSILKRMIAINSIRTALDNSGIEAPIHIFGSLDPISSILYFLAGAEIFDGLTWLKYSYFDNAAIYMSNFAVLNSDLGINTRDGQVKSFTITKNIYYLSKMKYAMRDFVSTKNYKMFDQIGKSGFGEILERCYNTFESNL